MISWMAIRLFFSGAAKRLLKGLSAAFEWLLSDPRNLPLVICAAMWAAHATFIVPSLRTDLTETEANLAAEQAAHLGTVNAFLAASKQAQKDAEANAQRVAREQETITDATVAEYRADLGDLRARFDRLRRARNPAAINSGSADPAGLPGVPAAAGRADAPAGQAGFPAPGDRQATELTLDDALIASEQALQLHALIDWVAAQSAVRFTPKEAARDE